MKRVTIVRDGDSEKSFSFDDYPLSIGGPGAQIPLGPKQPVAAHIGDEQGHPFIQPVAGGDVVWHNHERLSESAWLKSGDQIQIDDRLIRWQVQGDQILVNLGSADSVVTASPADMVPPPISARMDRSLPIPEAAPRSKYVRWITGSLFAGLLMAAMFVLLATPLLITVEPEAESLSLSGTFPVARLPGRILALPGDYLLTVEKPGYEKLQIPVSLDFGKASALKLQLKKLPGLLSLETRPPGAALTIDGKPQGTTPIVDLPLSAGAHSLKVEAERYRTIEQVLEVVGLGERQSLSLELQPDWAPVSISSEPPGAEILENGESIGRTPATLELVEGEHVLLLKLAGFKSHRQPLSVVAGKAQMLSSIELTPADGRLTLKTSPTGGVVSVDGKYKGVAPLEIPLASGESHRIKVTKAGFASRELSLTLEPDQTRELVVEFSPLKGVLFVTGEPGDATLLVDGQERGKAINRLELNAGRHLIEVRKRGYTSYRTEMQVDAGGSHTLEVVLKKKGTNPPSGLPASAAGNRSRVSAPSPGASLVRIEPSAPFTMGASRREAGRRANENLHKVELRRPFLLGIREVTNGEFRRFRPGHDSGQSGGVSLNGDRQPVVNVSWEDAVRYLNWLSEKEGLPKAYKARGESMVLIRPVNRGYRLPTEAEWARAARFPQPGQSKKFPWPGDHPVPPEPWGNYADSSAAGQLSLFMEDYNDGYPVTAPVASFRANELGLHDLDGNVAEWVQDYYSVHPGRGKGVARDPTGPETGRHRVVRGAGWRDASLTELRLSYRDYSVKPRNDLGFRVARYLD